MTKVHKSALNGGTLCGEVGMISCTGAGSAITCEKCKEILRPKSRAELLAALEAEYTKLVSAGRIPVRQ